MALRAADAAVDRRLRQLPVARRELARFLVGERREVERRERAAARPRAPGGVDRVLVGPRGQHEQRRLRDDRGRELAEPRGLLAAGVVQVLDHEQERRPRAGRLDQLPHDRHAAVLERLRVDVALDRGLVRGQRRADQAARVQDAVGRQAAGLDRLDDRAPALGRPGVRGDAEQAREQRGERAARLHLAEVEHLHAMTGDAARARGIHERLEQARLADAGFAARDDRAAAPRRHAALEQRVHQRQLGLAAGERQVVRAERAAQALGEQHLARVRAPGERFGIAHRVARERERPVDARRQQRALGDAGRRRARREVAGADRMDDRLRGAQRPLRLVAGEVLEAEDRDQAVAREPVGDAAVQRDRLVEQPLQLLRQLARLLRVERARAARRGRAGASRARRPSAARDRRRWRARASRRRAPMATSSSGSAPGSAYSGPLAPARRFFISSRYSASVAGSGARSSSRRSTVRSSWYWRSASV